MGEIIDILTQLEVSATMRSKLGLFDINKFCEDVFKDFLNILLKINLANLNEERNNYPGLDLGDEAAQIAFQITVDKSGNKIKETLERITAEDIAKYPIVRVLIVGKKQRSYAILDDVICKTINFSASNIWDLNDLASKALNLDIDSLIKLYDLARKELLRLVSDFSDIGESEVSKVSWHDLVEKSSKPKFSNINRIIEANIQQQNIDEETCKDLKEAFPRFIKKLQQLPRLSRDFLSVLIELSKYESDYDTYVLHYDDFLRRSQKTKQQINEELAFLEKYQLLYIYHVENELASSYIILSGVFKEKCLVALMHDFCQQNKISFQKVFRDLDFTDFAT